MTAKKSNVVKSEIYYNEYEREQSALRIQRMCKRILGVLFSITAIWFMWDLVQLFEKDFLMLCLYAGILTGIILIVAILINSLPDYLSGLFFIILATCGVSLIFVNDIKHHILMSFVLLGIAGMVFAVTTLLPVFIVLIIRSCAMLKDFLIWLKGY